MRNIGWIEHIVRDRLRDAEIDASGRDHSRIGNARVGLKLGQKDDFEL